MKAGIFDSGIGGLTVAKSVIEANIFEEIVYYGDTARVPYGNKDKNTIVRYSLEALEFFKNFDIDVLIIACNTVSAYAIDELRANTDIHVVGVIESGVISLQNKIPEFDKNILVLGTNATINSQKYENRLQKAGYLNIYNKATPLFVPIIEEELKDDRILNLSVDYYLNEFKDIDAVILGCTHFPLIKDTISKYLDDAIIIHSGEAIVEYLHENYNCKNKFLETKTKFFASDNPDSLKRIAKKVLNKENE